MESNLARLKPKLPSWRTLHSHSHCIFPSKANEPNTTREEQLALERVPSADSLALGKRPLCNLVTVTIAILRGQSRITNFHVPAIDGSGRVGIGEKERVHRLLSFFCLNSSVTCLPVFHG